MDSKVTGRVFSDEKILGRTRKSIERFVFHDLLKSEDDSSPSRFDRCLKFAREEQTVYEEKELRVRDALCAEYSYKIAIIDSQGRVGLMVNFSAPFLAQRPRTASGRRFVERGGHLRY